MLTPSQMGAVSPLIAGAGYQSWRVIGLSRYITISALHLDAISCAGQKTRRTALSPDETRDPTGAELDCTETEIDQDVKHSQVDTPRTCLSSMEGGVWLGEIATITVVSLRQSKITDIFDGC